MLHIWVPRQQVSTTCIEISQVKQHWAWLVLGWVTWVLCFCSRVRFPLVQTAVTHPSTNQAQCCLTWLISRQVVLAMSYTESYHFLASTNLPQEVSFLLSSSQTGSCAIPVRFLCDQRASESTVLYHNTIFYPQRICNWSAVLEIRSGQKRVIRLVGMAGPGKKIFGRF